MIKLNSWNINGIRKIYEKKCFMKWFNSVNSDIISFQEIKAQIDQIPEELYNHEKYFSYFYPSTLRGSGVATFTKIEPNEVIYGMGIEKFDITGRFLRLDFDDFILMNIYFPSFSFKGLEYKLEFYDSFLEYLDNLKGKNIIFSGDFNIAHTELDLRDPEKKKYMNGFKKIEREKIDLLIEKGFVDTFRLFNSNNGNYTWWSNRKNARKENKGIRLDYFFVNKELKENVLNSSILSDVRGSDHCPIQLELDI